MHLIDDVDGLYQEKKKEEEDLPPLKIALTHRYNNSKNAFKIAEEL